MKERWMFLAAAVVLAAAILPADVRAQEAPPSAAGGYDCVSTYVATWWSPETERHTGRAEGDLVVRELEPPKKPSDPTRLGLRWSSDPDCEVVALLARDGTLRFPRDQRCTIMNDYTELVVKLVSATGRIFGKVLEMDVSWRTDGRRWPKEKDEPDIRYAGSMSERAVCSRRSSDL